MRTPTHALLCLAALAACDRGARSAPATADVTAALPAATDAIVRVDVRALHATRAWAIVDALLAPQAELLDAIERACGFRPLDRIDAITVAGDGVRPGLSLAIVEGRFTAAEAHACFAKVMAADRDAEVTATEIAGITELSAEGFPETLHVRWLGDGAVLIPIEAITDRAYLEGVLAGPRLERGPLADELRAARATGAALLAAAAGDDRRGPPRLLEPLASVTGPVPPRRARATLALADGVAIELRLGFDDAAPAEAARAAARERLAAIAADPALAAFTPLVTTTTVGGEGAEVVIAGRADDAALAGIVAEILDGLALAGDAPPAAPGDDR